MCMASLTTIFAWITALSTSATAAVTEDLVADCRSDFQYAGGAAETADPLHSIRSGDPSHSTSASPLRALLPGATVISIAFSYRYSTGFGPTGEGTNFTVRVAGQAVYASPKLVDYRYSENRSNYSLPVPVSLSGLSIIVPSNATDGARISFEFDNNDRNVQLLLPLNLTLTCADGPCLAPRLWEPPERYVVFRAGEATEGNGTSPCPCFRIPALATLRGRLFAFAEARFHGCSPDVHPLNAVAFRHSLDGLVGKSWSEVRILARSNTSAGGQGLNYPTPIVDEVTGVLHLYYSDFGLGPYYMASADEGKTWSVPVAGTGVFAKNGAGMNGVQLADGRLVVPCTGEDGARATCFSDDHAATWTAGAAIRVGDEGGGHATAAAAVALDDLSGTALTGCGETSIAVDGRGPRTLSLTCRLGTSALVNHAVATSDDGGESWSDAQPLPGVLGPTCQGSVGPLGGSEGRVLVSAPFSHDGGLDGRENLALWEVDATQPAPVAQLRGRLWGCKGAYTAFSADGSSVLFEAGETFRYETIMLAHVDALS